MIEEWSRLKDSPMHRKLACACFKTPIEARLAVFEFIEGWYNPRRRHSAIGYLSPIDYENTHRQNTDHRSPSPSTETG
jgi:transposase InsO family protein